MRMTLSQFALKAPSGTYYYLWESADDGETLEVDLRELTDGLPEGRHQNEKRWMADQISNAARVYANRWKKGVSISCKKPYDTLSIRLWQK